MATKPHTNPKAESTGSLLQILQARFERNMHRHKDIEWKSVLAKLTTSDKAISTLKEMERTGGEPDVVLFDKKSGTYSFYDCSVESPIGRRSLCYDTEALNERKEHKPSGSAVEMAEKMDIELLNENQYRYLQTLGQFDNKTSSWIKTPASIRAAGGAIFGDFRYGQVFIYHNGAPSYYAARGFRGVLIV